MHVVVANELTERINSRDCTEIGRRDEFFIGENLGGVKPVSARGICKFAAQSINGNDDAFADSSAAIYAASGESACLSENATKDLI